MDKKSDAILDTNFKHRKTHHRMETLPLRTKGIKIAEALIIILEFSFTPFLSLLMYQLAKYDPSASPLLHGFLTFCLLSIPFLYALIWNVKSKQFDANKNQTEFGNQYLHVLNFITYALGIFLLPVLIGSVYIYYASKTHERLKMILN
jgi:hypothetical protein